MNFFFYPLPNFHAPNRSSQKVMAVGRFAFVLSCFHKYPRRKIHSSFFLLANTFNLPWRPRTWQKSFSVTTMEKNMDISHPMVFFIFFRSDRKVDLNPASRSSLRLQSPWGNVLARFFFYISPFISVSDHNHHDVDTSVTSPERIHHSAIFTAVRGTVDLSYLYRTPSWRVCATKWGWHWIVHGLGHPRFYFHGVWWNRDFWSKSTRSGRTGRFEAILMVPSWSARQIPPLRWLWDHL